ncbi:hypothetical protein ACFL5O_02750 [Myxococcota bacterium]
MYRGARNQAAVTIARYAYYDGGLVEFHDALGAVTRFRYHGDHRMAQATGPGGYSFHWHYDPTTGRCIRSYGDDGLWGIEASYEGSQTVFTEPDGGKWILKQFPDGTISHVGDPYGRVLQYVQDDSGRIVKQIMPGGTEYTCLYDATGRHYGRLDPFDHLVPPEDEEPNPNPLAHDGPVTAKGYLCGRPLGELTPALRGIPASVSAWLATASVQPRALSDAPIRDAMGRILEQVERDGSRRHFKHDAEGNVIGERLSPPRSTEIHPNEPGARNGWTTREYTSWNLLGAETSPLGSTTLYEYTHHEKWRAIVDANGNRTDHVRDQRHRIHQIHRYGSLYRRYLHDAFDAVIEEQDGDGNLLVKYQTGPHGLHVSATLQSGECYTYDYDSRGQFTLASSSEHEVVQRHLGLKLELDRRDGKGVHHRYTSDLRLAHTTYLERFVVRYQYLSGDQVAITTPEGDPQALAKPGAGGTRKRQWHL